MGRAKSASSLIKIKARTKQPTSIERLSKGAAYPQEIIEPYLSLQDSMCELVTTFLQTAKGTDITQGMVQTALITACYTGFSQSLKSSSKLTLYRYQRILEMVLYSVEEYASQGASRKRLTKEQLLALLEEAMMT